MTQETTPSVEFSPEPLPSGFKRGLLKEAVALTGKRFGGVLSLVAVASIPQIVQGVMEEIWKHSLIAGLIGFGLSILNFAMQPGFYVGMLRYVRSGEIKIADIFEHFGKFWRYLGLMILLVLGLLLGFLLLIIPGLILAARWSQAAYLLADENLGPLEALEKSWKRTEGATWQILVFVFLIVGINVLGLLALVVGLIYTIPLTWVAHSLLYEKLRLRATPPAVAA